MPFIVLVLLQVSVRWAVGQSFLFRVSLDESVSVRDRVMLVLRSSWIAATLFAAFFWIKNGGSPSRAHDMPFMWPILLEFTAALVASIGCYLDIVLLQRNSMLAVLTNPLLDLTEILAAMMLLGEHDAFSPSMGGGVLCCLGAAYVYRVGEERTKKMPPQGETPASPTPHQGRIWLVIAARTFFLAIWGMAGYYNNKYKLIENAEMQFFSYFGAFVGAIVILPTFHRRFFQGPVSSGVSPNRSTSLNLLGFGVCIVASSMLDFAAVHAADAEARASGGTGAGVTLATAVRQPLGVLASLLVAYFLFKQRERIRHIPSIFGFSVLTIAGLLLMYMARLG